MKPQTVLFMFLPLWLSVSKRNQLSGSPSSMNFSNLCTKPLSFLNKFTFTNQHVWDLDVQF